MSGPVAQASHAGEVRSPPDLAEADPWRKSSILTLDGGGVRGLASLWMLKILMDEIATCEKNHQQPHTSSFFPEPYPPQSNSNSNPEIEPTINSNAARAQTQTSTTGALGNGFLTLRTRTTRGDDLVPEFLKPHEGYLPCHYFDYIAGTSSGGLNAIMLARLRMPVEDCLKVYPGMAKAIFFKKKRSRMRRIMTMSSTKYDCIPLEQQIQKIVGYRQKEGMNPQQRGYEYEKFHSPEDLCRTIVLANEHNGPSEHPHMFRSYPHEAFSELEIMNPGPACVEEIWKIARATSAAPTLFDPISISGKYYSDGALGGNNPTERVLEEVTTKTRIKKWDQAFGVVVSIGTGQKSTGVKLRAADTALRAKRRNPGLSELPVVKNGLRVIKSLKDRALDVDQRTHAGVKNVFDNCEFKHYYRWTGGEAVGCLKLDHWRPEPKARRKKPATAELIEREARQFMSQEAVMGEVRKCAEELVRRRRARIACVEDNGRWRRFTHCTLLPCPGYCQELLQNKTALKHHITSKHPDKFHDDDYLTRQVNDVNERYPNCEGGPF